MVTKMLSKIDKTILTEVRKVKNDQTIRNKDVMEWSTGDIKPHDGEEIFRLPELGINVALKIDRK